MSKTEKFNISFLRMSGYREQMFLSVTSGFEHGPGIQRDGITEPRMRDPHSVPFVCHSREFGAVGTLKPTTNPYVQRAGTWTLYQHLKEFVDRKGKDWLIIGVQSCGDLTMNPWHIAYLGDSHFSTQKRKLCGLLTQNDPQEPIGSRVYRCMVKWNQATVQKRNKQYEWLDLTISDIPQGYAVTIKDSGYDDSWLRKLKGYNPKTKDIAPLLEFALSGKPVIEKGNELSLSNAVDRFQDVRHIFNLPTVAATGALAGNAVSKVNFGEYQLFRNLNVRRAALSSAIIIDLKIKDFVVVDWSKLQEELKKKHFKEVSESPTRRGQFRRYTDDANKDKVEIFFPHNVYPFGVLGAHPDVIVCLASGGLSGRVGNTLEGITRIMFDFFGCEDAMVLDEGLDTFQVVNPPVGESSYKYSNEEVLRKVLCFTKRLLDKEHADSLDPKSGNHCLAYHFKGGMKEWPLNKVILGLVDRDAAQGMDEEYTDVLAVAPLRSQMRSVVIFAVKKPQPASAQQVMADGVIQEPSNE